MRLFPQSLSAARRRGPAALALILLAALLSGQPLSAASIEEREKKKEQISAGIKKYRINIGKLQEGIRAQEEQMRETREVELDLLTELQDIDTRLMEQNEKLRSLADRMAGQEELIGVKEAEIAAVEQRLEKTRNHVRKRMQVFYRNGELGLINITFSDRSFSELLRFQDSFLDLVTYDREVIDRYRRTIDELTKAVESLRLQQDIYAELIRENRDEQQALDDIREEKTDLLARIRTQAKLHEKAAAEMEAAAENLTASLTDLQDQEKRLEQSFLYNKGNHPPPVEGVVITRFKEQTENLLGIASISNGIAIEAPSGSTVRAIHEGVVHYAGYLRGYGNTVIVNHGNQYYSIYARVERLLVAKDQQVNERTPIGIMGDTATIMAPGLYLELRQDSDQLDPLAWLDTSGLSFAD